jgi:hypothetical protein
VLLSRISFLAPQISAKGSRIRLVSSHRDGFSSSSSSPPIDTLFSDSMRKRAVPTPSYGKLGSEDTPPLLASMLRHRQSLAVKEPPLLHCRSVTLDHQLSTYDLEHYARLHNEMLTRVRRCLSHPTARRCLVHTDDWRWHSARQRGLIAESPD